MATQTLNRFFFANADTDSTRELIIIASWQQQHYDVNGKLYGTYVFDYNLSDTKLQWKLLASISSKLEGAATAAIVMERRKQRNLKRLLPSEKN